MNDEYEVIIGLEVHAQLLTKSKMYCRCGADYASAKPNTRVCPVCLGMPGVLPTINKRAVEKTILTALALNCRVPERTKFDRKNYPYPDLVKGYQISQYDQPIGIGGWMEVETDGAKRRLGITRVHLEEDVCKLLHRGIGTDGFSLVDANRSGVPLMEIVSEPDMRSPAEARNYLVKLRSILRYLGVSLANMEEGSFRCDANISIRPAGSKELEAKVEIKNMNSFKAVYQALEYEADRQKRMARTGKRLVQETRGWLDEKARTVSQRSKEYAHDYRYFPEPDLPPLDVSRQWVENVRMELTELPEERLNRFMSELGLSDYDAALLTSSREMADYYENTLRQAGTGAKELANWIAGPVSSILNAESTNIYDFSLKVPPGSLAGLLSLVEKSVINPATAKGVLEDMYRTGKSADTLVEEKGLKQISGSGELDEIAAKVIGENASAVADYHDGKEQALKYLIGKIMRLTRGRANPNIAADILKQKLKEGQ